MERAERRQAASRRRRRLYRFVDRRTGFDRRMRYPLLGSLRDNAWVLVSVLLAVNVLSLLDGALTLFEVSSGIAVEGNPLLRALIGTDPRVALAFKVGVVGTVSAVIWTARRYRAVIGLSLVALTAYAAVIVVHLLGLNHAGIL